MYCGKRQNLSLNTSILDTEVHDIFNQLCCRQKHSKKYADNSNSLDSASVAYATKR